MFWHCTSARDILFLFWLYLIIQTIRSASIGVNFKIHSMAKCTESIPGILTLYGVSLEECVHECGARRKCESVKYFRSRHACVLMSLTAMPDTTTKALPCTIAKKEDIVAPSPCLCSLLKEVCIQGPDGNDCLVKECEPLQVNNGVVLGNRVAVGSVLKYQCSAGYVPAGQTDSTTCMVSGHWSMQPDCVPGTLIGEACTINADCTSTMAQCIENKCFCNALYRWNSTIKDCVKVCDQISDEFQRYSDTGFLGYNNRMLSIGNAECQTTCIADPKCFSFEAHARGGCSIGNVTMTMVRDAHPVGVLSMEGWVTHSRLCS